MANHEVLGVVKRLSEGLGTVNLSQVSDLVEKFGLYGAARILGYDVSHYNNLLMSGRLAIENLRNTSPKTILEYAHQMKSRLNKPTYEFIVENHEELQAAIDRNIHLDYDHDWFSANTMITMYSANPSYGKDGIETPQYTWMRIAIQLYHDSPNALTSVIRAYEEMSVGWYTPASPTIFNAGMRDPQMASCLVAGTKVITQRGPISIEEVQIGDQVNTHQGNIRKVTQIHKNLLGDRKLYYLKALVTNPILITEDHRLWACKRDETPKWVPVQDITKDHYIAIGNGQYEGINLSKDKINELTIELINDNLSAFDDIYSWSQDSLIAIIDQVFDENLLYRIGPNCAATFYYATRRFGIVTCNFDGTIFEILDNKDAYVKSSDFVVVEDKAFIKVSDVTITNKTPEYVYTLGIEDDHSYNAEGLIVENCFLLTIGDDLESILKTGIYRGGMISKSSGGLGFDISRVRHSEIRETGWSNGIIPMLQLYNYMVRYVDQCFTPETTIYTEAGPKYIQNIMPGDRVVTHDGSLDDVRFTMPHDYNGDIIEVKVHNTFKPVKVAPTHPFLVIRNQAKGVNYSIIENRLNKGYVTPEWVDAAALKDTDLVAFPVPTYVRDLQDFTPEDMYMYGLMIGDGSIDQRDGQCRICLGTERKAHLIDFVHKYLALRNIRFNEHPDSGCVHITWSGGSNFKFNRTSLYDSDTNKIIHPYYMHLPREKSFALIAGLLASDGSIAKEWVLDTTSEYIAEAVRYILLRMGVGTSGYIRDRIGETHDSAKGPITNRKLCYSLRIPKVQELAHYLGVQSGKFTKYLLHNGIVWSRVEYITQPSHYEGKIYDLEISKNHNYLTHMGLAHNGGRRKGAATIFLRPHHIDVEDFIELPRKVGDKYARAHDLNICLWTSWIFWERVRTNGIWTLFCPARIPQLNDLYGVEFTKAYLAAEKDTTIASRHKKVINARELYDKILNVQRETGMPYLMNGDAANIKSNHRHLGYIRSSNLCVAGETPILTKKGYFQIQSLKNQQVDVWNGNEWSSVTVKQTAPRRHLITIVFSNGRSLTCTPDHKFIIGDGPLKEAKRVPAQYLLPGMKIRQENLPVVDGEEPFPHAFIHGALCAFGCFTSEGPIIDIMGPALSSIVNHPDMITLPDGTKAFPDNLPQAYAVPINSSVQTKLDWLAGFFDTRSFVSKIGATLIHINDKLLQDVQLLLTTLGTRSVLVHTEPKKIPLNDTKTITLQNYELAVPWEEFAKLKDLGLKCRCTTFDPPAVNKALELVVTDIVDIGRLSPTYCFTEEKNNAGIFNGILTGQCLEVIEFTDDETIAVCNLHSLSLRKFGHGPVDKNNSNTEAAIREAVDFKQLGHISQRVIENLNRVIDHNWYPLDSVKNGVVKPKIINKSNKRHRPVGMGISGFAELLHILDLPFEDPQVNILNKMIFACMYWNALAQSIQLSIRDGPYESFRGSPTSHGLLQFDLWKEEFKIVGPNAVRKEEDDEPVDPSIWGQTAFYLYTKDGESIQDVIKPTWNDIKRCMMKYGLRNSLLIALMPTASTAQIRRNCESVEAHQNNMYSRKVLKCSYPVLNRYLVEDLDKLHAWNNATVEFIRVKNGSIQGLGRYIRENSNLFPEFVGDFDRVIHIEKKYKTMWEIPQKVFMKLAAERSRYIDQSSSTNVYIRDCTDEKLRACHLYANMLGLKTIMYYLRQTGGETIKFTADPAMIQHIQGITVEEAKEEKKEEHQDSAATKGIASNEIELTGTFSSVSSKPTGKFICTDEICTSCT